jgi:oligosaccharide repeat unit polymerase
VQLTNPVIVFFAVWGATYALYSLRLSALLLDKPHVAVVLLMTIGIPFLCGYVLVSTINFRLQPRKWRSGEVRADFARELIGRFHSLSGKLVILSVIWLVISSVEIVVSKGLPIIWIITGAGLTYQDFGIHSLHGFTNSLLLASSLISLALYFQSRRRSYLIMPIVSTIWAIVVVSRNLLLVNIIQLFMLWFRYYARNIGRILSRSLVFGFAILYVFGAVGDARTGAKKFVDLAEPTIAIPAWVPSGFFWAYVYITTPLDNMVYNVTELQPSMAATFPNTLSSLLPSIVRSDVVSANSKANQGLVSAAFNASSAFIGPYQDEGLPGVFLFSALIGVACTIFWYKRSFFGYFGYCVLAQCLFFSNFWNHFLDLPVIFQLFWFYIYKIRFREMRA